MTNTLQWADFIAMDYVFPEYVAGARVLDVGFGHGEQMLNLLARGCDAIGVEYNPALARAGRFKGLNVCLASAERLPFRTASMDGLVCKVVVPYTDEAVAIGEIARVLKPNAVARVSYQGLGYSLRYLLRGPDWKKRVYAVRVIANTAGYRLTGRRLPRWLGDTLYQSTPALRRYYARSGLELVKEHPSRTYAGAPVFMYHTLRRVATASQVMDPAGDAVAPTRRRVAV